MPKVVDHNIISAKMVVVNNYEGGRVQEVIKAQRLRLGLSQDELANEVGCKRSTIASADILYAFLIPFLLDTRDFLDFSSEILSTAFPALFQ